MQKAKVLSAVMLAMAAGGATAQDVAEAASLPATISFDGFCDMMTGITKLGTTYTATYDAYTNCGLLAVVAGGPAGTKLQGLKGAGGSFTAETYPYYGATYIFNISTKGTWAVTDVYGDAVNSGTWTAGLAGQRGTKPALSPR
jgi:hypothetical protein